MKHRRAFYFKVKYWPMFCLDMLLLMLLLIGNQSFAEKVKNSQVSYLLPAEKFVFSLGYEIAYNDLEEVDEKTLNHQVDVLGAYKLNRHTSIYGNLGFNHQTKGQYVFRDNDTDEYHSVAFLNFGVYSKMSALPKYFRKSAYRFVLSLPVTRKNIIDGHLVTASASNVTTTQAWNKFSIFNKFSARYTWHRLKFSMYSNGRLNRDWLLSESLGLAFDPEDNLGVRFSLGVHSVRYLDSSWDLSFGNQLSIFYNQWDLQFFVSYINDSYPENDRLDFGYYDKYRKLYIVGVTYAL